jgi:hypothetical protein
VGGLPDGCTSTVVSFVIGAGDSVWAGAVVAVAPTYPATSTDKDEASRKRFRDFMDIPPKVIEQDSPGA